jgi:hypothetical protein
MGGGVDRPGMVWKVKAQAKGTARDQPTIRVLQCCIFSALTLHTPLDVDCDSPEQRFIHQSLLFRHRCISLDPPFLQRYPITPIPTQSLNLCDSQG